MKRFIVSVLVVLSSVVVNAQQGVDHHAEIGLSLGGLNYVGDISPKLTLAETRPAVQIFYRHNFPNNASVLRFNVLNGGLYANESKQKDPLPQSRGASFDAFVTEIAALYEYNFFDYRHEKKQSWFSPYLFGGVALTAVWEEDNKAFFTIPFGVGVKYVVTRNLNINLEYGARKVFSDNLDGVTDEAASSSSLKNDWYHFLGISFSWTLYNYLCPVKVGP